MTLNVRMNPTVTVVGNLEMTSGSEVPHIREMRFHFESDAPTPGQAAVIQAVWDSERWLWAVSQWQPLEAVESAESVPETAAGVEAVEALPAHEHAATTHSDRDQPEPAGAPAPDVAPSPEPTPPVRQESAQRRVFAFGEKNPSAQAKAPAPKPAAEPKADPTDNQTPDAPAVANSRDSAEPRPGFAFGQKPSQTAPSSTPRRMYTPPRPAARPGSAQQGGSATTNTVKTAGKPASSATPASQSRQPLNAMQAKATVPVRAPQQVGGAPRRGGFGMGPAETHAIADMPAAFPAASAEARGTLNSSDSDDRLRQWGLNPTDDFSDLIPF